MKLMVFLLVVVSLCLMYIFLILDAEPIRRSEPRQQHVYGHVHQQRPELGLPAHRHAHGRPTHGGPGQRPDCQHFGVVAIAEWEKTKYQKHMRLKHL